MAVKQALGLFTRPSAISTNAATSTKLFALGGVRHARPDYGNRAFINENPEMKAMERNFTREWKHGDVYAPHDLSAAEARKWRQKKAPTTDAFDELSKNPLDLYKNFSVMSEYMTEQGRIRPRSQTGLRRVNQRRLAKAIRRAIALGLMPSVYRHPEILKRGNFINN